MATSIRPDCAITLRTASSTEASLVTSHSSVKIESDSLWPGRKVGCILGVFALMIAHCGGNCVAVARESFGEKAAKAGARASDEDT